MLDLDQKTNTVATLRIAVGILVIEVEVVMLQLSVVLLSPPQVRKWVRL
jgi:hypothetical protein